MFRKILTMAAASTALASVPLLAAPGGGQGPAGGSNAGGNANVNAGGAGGPAGAALDARLNSMGPANASPTGIEHANPNSVLNSNATTTTRVHGSAAMDRQFPGTKGSTKVTTGSLSGLTTGMTLTSNGTTVGTVQQIRTSPDGTVRVVVVQGTNGRMFAIPANKLTLSGGTLTTTARLNGINGGTAFTNPAVGVSQGPNHASTTGIAHANSHSVLAGGAVASTALPGLATGLTVQSSTGTTLGTVTQVVTDSSGNVRLVVVTSPTGEIFRLAPTTLTMNGDVVVTSQTGIGG
jgi:sporulation protein YlmC with PRC-barrel domain